MTSHNERAEMNNRTAKHRTIMALCCMFALMLATIGLSAPAATAATAAEGSLTVTYQYQEAALNNADINLYRKRPQTTANDRKRPQTTTITTAITIEI